MKTMESNFMAIENVAESFGFRAERSNWNVAEIKDDTRTVNFTSLPDIKWDVENKVAHVTVTITASIATMGGSPDADELLMRADRIAKAAKLVKMLKAMEISYDQQLN